MIKKVNIKSFQSISDVSFELGQFTIIVGDNDVGKSAILRALSGCLFNDSNKANVRHGKVSSSVTMVLDNGKVKWVRGATNTYLLKGNQDRSSLEFTKIGKQVPPEISDLLDVKEITLAGESICLQYQPQFEGPIIVSKTSGVLAGLFDEVVGVGLLNRAVGLVRKDINSSRSKHKFLSERLESVRAEVAEESELVSQLKVVYDSCQEWIRWESIRDIRSDKQELADLSEKIESFSLSLYNLRKFKKVFDVSILCGEHRNLVAEIGRIAALKHKVDKLLVAVKKLVSYIRIVCEIEDAYQEIVVARNNITDGGERITSVGVRLKQFQSKREEVLNQLGICPTCGFSIKGK